jgi:GH25 family lysozyme M1 (1,4-beta-N-acetylmuramidase)/LysM repeat protein
MKIGKYHRRKRSALKKLINGMISGALTIMLVLSFCAPAQAAGRVDFIDASHHQATKGLPLSYFQTIKRAGTDGAAFKVSEGNSYRDPSASVNIANARAAGLRVNAYHYGLLTSVADAKEEAQWFDKNLQADGLSKTNDGYVVLDIEESSLTRDADKLTSYVNAFLDEMHSLGYDRTDIYTGKSFYENRLVASKLDNKQPWLARYASDGKTVLDPGNNRGSHQWSSSYVYTVNGANKYFDVNIDYAGKYTGAVSSKVGKIGNVSLVNYLKSKGKAWSYSAREKLAKQYGITGYKGTAAQNIALLAKLKAGVKPAKVIAVDLIKQHYFTSVKKVKMTRTAGLYRSVEFTSRLRYYKKGTAFTVKSVVYSKAGTPRLKVSSGFYLTANKDYVSSIKSPVKKVVKKPSAKIYKVKSGDSLWAIAKAKKTTVKALKSKNHLHSDLIYPGEKLKY